jgi:hypothetical protein
VATFYRITKSNPPTVEDFKSHAELGLSKPPDLPQRRWEGVSMWNDIERATALALRRPKLGTFIAEVELPDSVERAPEGSPGHFEVYGSAIDLHSRVVQTQPVRQAEP